MSGPLYFVGGLMIGGGYMMGMWKTIPYIQKQVCSRWNGLKRETIGIAAVAFWPVGVPALWVSSKKD